MSPAATPILNLCQTRLLTNAAGLGKLFESQTNGSHREALATSHCETSIASRGCILANRDCWAADSRSLVVDLRDDETCFDSPAIVQVFLDPQQPAAAVYRDRHAAPCGVPACSPKDQRVVFIQADPAGDDDWQYCAWHRGGKLIDLANPGYDQRLDARNLTPPFTHGALRGGTHLHTFNDQATAVVSTYEDHVLAVSKDPQAAANRRAIAVHVLGHPVTVPPHPRNHDGCSYSVLVSELHDSPQPGSDQISLATGEAWLATVGQPAGSKHRIAFHGTVCDQHGHDVVELFLITLPDELRDLARATNAVAGTVETRPAVPSGVRQQRLTFTAERPFPGIVAPQLAAGPRLRATGPRHWAVGSPDGHQIGGYLADEHGVAQFWTVATDGGLLRQITHRLPPPTSPFTWHPNGSQVAYHADGSVMLVSLADGTMQRLTPPMPAGQGPTHHACVFSPDGQHIAYLQPVDDPATGRAFNQLHIVTL